MGILFSGIFVFILSPNSDLLIAIYSMDQPDWVSSKSYVELAKLSFEILDDPPEAPDLRQKIFDLSSQITRPGARSMHFEEKRQLFKDAYHTCMTYAEIMDRMPHHKLSVTPKSPDRLRVPLATETASQKKASSEVQSVTSAVATNIGRSQSPIGTQRSTPSPRSQTSTPQVEQTSRSVFFPRFASVNPQLPQIKVEEGQLPTPVNHGLDATVFPIASPKTDHRGILPSSVGPRLSGIRATSQGPQTRTANTSRTVTNNAYHVPLVSELSTILPVTRFARPGEGGYTHPSQRGYIRNDVQYNYPAELLNNTANGYEPSQGDKPTPMTDAPLWNEDTDDLPRPVRIIRRAWNRNHLVFPQKSALATVGIKLESTHQYSGDDDPEKFEAMLVSVISFLEIYNLMGPRSMTEQVQVYATRLTGKAEEFYRKELMPQKGYGRIFTLESVVLALYTRFITATGLMRPSVTFNTLEQGSMTVLDFYDALNRAANSMNDPPGEGTIRHRFMTGLDPAIRLSMASLGLNEYQTPFKQLLESATRIDESRRMLPSHTLAHSAGTISTKNSESPKSRIRPLVMQSTTIVPKVDKLQKPPSTVKASSSDIPVKSARIAGACFTCGKTGHIARDCPAAEKPNPSIKSLSVRIAEPEAGDDETVDQNADQPSDTEQQQDDGQYILSLSEEEYQRAIYEDDSDEFAAEEE
ncbi:hypothetical protein SISNIDRAFT_467896 [Sistotremastrum niveocremeum HHB9708]|uniref:CCHC-type domain-containing protein n=1 Tax=Sistotremastrum niveocremeum HHB9708 TaxID=1314777 RepID=A0A164SBN5_9AGAM|nr:hypothetical protein SISNIDRAFT_467896 [Sistotremastrum niveocremeum HHB9708]